MGSCDGEEWAKTELELCVSSSSYKLSKQIKFGGHTCHPACTGPATVRALKRMLAGLWPRLLTALVHLADNEPKSRTSSAVKPSQACTRRTGELELAGSVPRRESCSKAVLKWAQHRMAEHGMARTAHHSTAPSAQHSGRQPHLDVSFVQCEAI